MTLHGRCLCGKVKVEVDDSKEPVTTALCHCTNCLSTSSGVASVVSILSEDSVKLSGTIKQYEDKTTSSGKALTRSFCSECGSPVSSVSPNFPGKVVLKYGLFGQDHAGKYPKPGVEIYCKNKNPWEPSIEGVKSLEGSF
ncbi:uncharacterized protein PFL1_04921 [Pseudozyma flocculosa PF-1]|uniref:Related to DUF636 domain protein n=2 Tax=Pseudozyma flocculosa TaxID=84751 RepID=A0A5C3EYV4_9BASI|nr:uncharacterized protein PFL1_04921 [Pseudozyma flocculosa PF-1]EPQ27382.1 hypothetical protein PFL1_04921 [Pseudozyma flocculosa PF-1]SPO36201.1 related to DUF636 domain protein [Pseudozyma flocculosa]